MVTNNSLNQRTEAMVIAPTGVGTPTTTQFSLQVLDNVNGPLTPIISNASVGNNATANLYVQCGSAAPTCSFQCVGANYAADPTIAGDVFVSAGGVTNGMRFQTEANKKMFFEFGSAAAADVLFTLDDAAGSASLTRDQNSPVLSIAQNNTAGTGAYAGFLANNSTGGGILTAAINSSYTVDAAIAGYAYFHAISTPNGIMWHSDANHYRFVGSNASTDVYADCNAGTWTYPKQPSFFAYNSTNDTNQTGAGTTVTVQFDTELFDRASNFAANTFTAPTTGIYRFEASVYCASITAAMTVFDLYLVTTSNTVVVECPNSLAQNRSINLSALVPMTAGDTATIQLKISNGAGNTATIVGSASSGGLLVTYFSGNLVA